MFTGCGTALVTPFRATARSMSPRCASWSAARSTPASIFWCLAAPPAKAPRSRAKSICAWSQITVEEAAGKMPVLGGAGGYNTHEVIELARELERLGADGILSVTPYYNKPTQEGLYQHYKAIAEAVPLPIVVYSVQGRTGVNVEPATLARLAADRKHRRRQRSLRQHHADGNRDSRRAPKISSCSPATMPSPFR